MANVSRSIAKLMHMGKKYIPTSKSMAWNYPKFHELTHIVDDMMRFGAPQNFCAQRPESLLIVAAKQPCRCVQKRHKGVVYELQATQQLCYSLMINTVHDGIQQCHGAPLPQSSFKATSMPTDTHIYENTKGTTHGSIGDNNVPHFDIKWNTKTNVSKLQLDNSLLCYLYTQFGHTVNFCTEYKRDIYTFRCNPSYGSAGPIFD